MGNTSCIVTRGHEQIEANEKGEDNINIWETTGYLAVPYFYGLLVYDIEYLPNVIFPTGSYLNINPTFQTACDNYRYI
jgi:hypothetical protein